MHFPFIYTALAVATTYISGAAAQTSRCWTSAAPVSANYATLSALRIDAPDFCNLYGSGPGIISGARFVIGFQSAGFWGIFASNESCLSTFNTLVTDCYGTANPNLPATLGGVRTDPGGAELVIAFGDGTKL